jgi:hypothetical protein
VYKTPISPCRRSALPGYGARRSEFQEDQEEKEGTAEVVRGLMRSVMNDYEMVPDPIPNENDFKSREAEFEALSRNLAEKEVELATLENELGFFESRYARAVGVLFAELDELEKEIAKELFRLHPEEKYKRGFESAQRKANNSRRAVNEKIGQGEKKAFTPSKELKELFYKVAKTVHPDHATNDDEIEYRNILMARANEAFHNEDKETLEQILVEWEHRDKKSIHKELPSKKLDLLEKKVFQIKLRLKEIEVKIHELKQSELYQLMLKVNQAENRGRDLLSEMKNDIQRQIEAANLLLNSLKQQGKGL